MRPPRPAPMMRTLGATLWVGSDDDILSTLDDDSLQLIDGSGNGKGRQRQGQGQKWRKGAGRKRSGTRFPFSKPQGPPPIDSLGSHIFALVVDRW